jgi:hypothetical protein
MNLEPRRYEVEARTTTFSAVTIGSSILFGLDVSLKLCQNYFYVDVCNQPVITLESGN